VVEAVCQAVRALRQDARTAAAACGPVATEAVAALQACRASSGVAANTVDEAVALHHRAAVTEAVQSPASRASPLPSEARAGARCAAASPADALPAQVDAQAAASCLVPRCAAGSSAERTVRTAPALAWVRRVPRRRRVPEVLRLALRQPAVLRREVLRERSRQEVLHQRQQEAVVRLRQRAVAQRRQPEPRRAPARRPAVAPPPPQRLLSFLPRVRAA